jgi:hypothetical protein
METDDILYGNFNYNDNQTEIDNCERNSNKQHVAFVIGLGSLYPAKDVVEKVLAPVEGEVKRVIDLGTCLYLESFFPFAIRFH